MYILGSSPLALRTSTRILKSVKLFMDICRINKLTQEGLGQRGAQSEAETETENEAVFSMKALRSCFLGKCSLKEYLEKGFKLITSE